MMALSMLVIVSNKMRPAIIRTIEKRSIAQRNIGLRLRINMSGSGVTGVRVSPGMAGQGGLKFFQYQIHQSSPAGTVVFIMHTDTQVTISFVYPG
jgi:hypothetical protein